MRSALLYATAAILLAAMLTSPKDVSIRLSRQVIMVNDGVTLTCHVAADPRNRQLNAGLRFLSVSSRQLDGAEALKTWTFTVAHVPCPWGDDSYMAYCQVLRNDDSVAEATAKLLLANCE